MARMTVVTEHVLRTDRHQTSYLQAGDPDAPLVVFVHGWPERAISWRHQIEALSNAGYLVVAPDMRGYGNSTVHPEHIDYSQEPITADMLELLAGLGRSTAAWVGHDWGSPVVWSVASHHPDVCAGVSNLCVPYLPGGFTLDELVPLVNRELYPADQFPAGQWEYWLFYRANFARARAGFEANITNTVKALFRRGSAASLGTPSRTAHTRINNGWWGPTNEAPDLPADSSVVDEESLRVYVAGLQNNGFFGPDSWYMNDPANTTFAGRSVNNGRLDMPVLFFHGRYDTTCESIDSQLASPMRASCSQLTEVIVDSGHWMAQEQPDVVNDALIAWLRGLTQIGRASCRERVCLAV